MLRMHNAPSISTIVRSLFFCHQILHVAIYIASLISSQLEDLPDWLKRYARPLMKPTLVTLLREPFKYMLPNALKNTGVALEIKAGMLTTAVMECSYKELLKGNSTEWTKCAWSGTKRISIATVCEYSPIPHFRKEICYTAGILINKMLESEEIDFSDGFIPFSVKFIETWSTQESVLGKTLGYYLAALFDGTLSNAVRYVDLSPTLYTQDTLAKYEDTIPSFTCNYLSHNSSSNNRSEEIIYKECKSGIMVHYNQSPIANCAGSIKAPSLAYE